MKLLGGGGREEPEGRPERQGRGKRARMVPLGLFLVQWALPWPPWSSIEVRGLLNCGRRLILANRGSYWVLLPTSGSCWLFGNSKSIPRPAARTGGPRGTQGDPGGQGSPGSPRKPFPGPCWLFLAPAGFSWLLLAFPGFSWLLWLSCWLFLLPTSGSCRLFLASHGSLGSWFEVLHGSCWLLAASPSSSWLHLLSPGSAWLFWLFWLCLALLAPPGSSGSFCLLLAPPGSSWLLWLLMAPSGSSNIPLREYHDISHQGNIMI